MKLAGVPFATRVRVTRVGGDGAYRRRLLELGLVPGTPIEVVRVAPLGDPLELLVRGGSLSIRRAEAEVIDVERES